MDTTKNLEEDKKFEDNTKLDQERSHEIIIDCEGNLLCKITLAFVLIKIE